MNTKLTLVEWLAKTEESSPEWAEEFLLQILKPNKKHDGDCTAMIHTCDLCCLEGILKDYIEYYFSEEE